MNNSFARLIDGMNATLRKEVLTRLDDEFARGQVFGIINLLNTFNWGPPGLINADRTHVNFSAGSFGRITTMAGAPRIMQFGVKYGF